MNDAGIDTGLGKTVAAEFIQVTANADPEPGSSVFFAVCINLALIVATVKVSNLGRFSSHK